MKAPCKDCPNRNPSCHATCPEYNAFRAECEQIYRDRLKAVEITKCPKKLKPYGIYGNQ